MSTPGYDVTVDNLDLLGGDSRVSPRQRELLDRLQERFLVRGFRSATLDELAADLNCSKSTLYALAPSKEQLAVRVVRRFFAAAADHVDARIADQTGATAKVQAYLDGVHDQLALAGTAFVSDIIEHVPARAVYEQNARVAAQRVHELIRAGVESGEFQVVHAELIATMAGVLVQNIQAGVIAERTGGTHAEAFAALAELLLHGLCAR